MFRPNSKLTQGELDVLKWAALGKSDAMIADILAVSPQNIKNHICNILKKLDVTNRVEASVRAIALGLV